MEIHHAFHSALIGTGLDVHGVVAIAVSSILVFYELPRRIGGAEVGLIAPRCLAKSCTSIALKCLPEVSCVFMAATVTCALRVLGPRYCAPENRVYWDTVVKDWPILYGADTLLAFQAILRLAIIFVASRQSPKRNSNCLDEQDVLRAPISNLVAVFALGGMVARAYLNAHPTAYDLDGPVGMSRVPAYCEVLMVPLLALIVRRTLRTSPMSAVASVAAASAFASQHYLNLASDPNVDRLFTLAHTLEIFSAFAFLVSTIRGLFGAKCTLILSAKAGFVYIMMACQQCLAAYYFLTGPAIGPETVGAGRPWCLLILGNVLALGAYLCAGALWLGVYMTKTRGRNGSFFTTTTPNNTSTEAPIVDISSDVTAATLSFVRISSVHA